MEKIKDFVAENRLALFIGILLLVLICWLHHDNHRNDTDYHNTDTTVADIDKRISSIEQRLDGMSERIEQTQKAVTGISQRISTSLSKTLKEQINKERKIHKRQIWQNRFWCILIGAGIGFAVSK